MPITNADVTKVAKLSRLALSSGEVAKYTEQLGKILHYIELGSAKQYLALCKNPDLWDPLKGLKAVVANPEMPGAIRAHYRIIQHRFRVDPALTVVAGSLALGARIAEEKLGVRTVGMHL